MWRTNRWQRISKHRITRLAVLVVAWVLGTAAASYAQQPWQSRLVRTGPEGRLVYATDDGSASGHRLPDFSYAGYRNSEVPLPNAPIRRILHPDADNEDDASRIQAALDAVAARVPLDPKTRVRGAVLLAAGVFEVATPLRVNHDGLVLRGVGDGEDPRTNTILRAIGSREEQPDVLSVGGGGYEQWRARVPGSQTLVTTPVVQAESRRVEVEDASAFAVDAPVILYHPCTDAWLQSIDYGGAGTLDLPLWYYRGYAVGTHTGWQCRDTPGEGRPGWAPESNFQFDIVYKRTVTAIDGRTLTLDAPVFYRLDRALSPVYAYRFNERIAGIVSNVGVENLRIDIQPPGAGPGYTGCPDPGRPVCEDEDHAQNGVALWAVEDAWVRNVTVLHFAHAGITTRGASRVTVAHTRALDPVARREGGRMYNFSAGFFSQGLLFVDCYARNGRHHFVSNGGTTASGIVFLRTTSERAYAASESHKHWSQGLLFDNHREIDFQVRPPDPMAAVGLYNRGAWADHAWSAVHSVAWNTRVANAQLIVQRPPTAQNYAIGCFADDPNDVSGRGPFAYFTAAAGKRATPDYRPGYIEGINTPGLTPSSLYEAQLIDRGVTLKPAEAVALPLIPRRAGEPIVVPTLDRWSGQWP